MKAILFFALVSLLFVQSFGLELQYGSTLINIYITEGEGSPLTASKLYQSFADKSLDRVIDLRTNSVGITGIISAHDGQQHIIEITEEASTVALFGQEIESFLTSSLGDVSGDLNAYYERIEVELSLAAPFELVVSRLDFIKDQLSSLLENPSSLLISVQSPRVSLRQECEVTTAAEVTTSLTTASEATTSLTTATEITTSLTTGVAEVTTSLTTSVAEATTALTTVAEVTTALTTVAEVTTALTTVAEATTSLTTDTEVTTSLTTDVFEATTSLTTVAEVTTALTTVAEVTTALTTVAEVTTALTTVAEATTAIAPATTAEPEATTGVLVPEATTAALSTGPITTGITTGITTTTPPVTVIVVVITMVIIVPVGQTPTNEWIIRNIWLILGFATPPFGTTIIIYRPPNKRQDSFQFYFSGVNAASNTQTILRAVETNDPILQRAEFDVVSAAGEEVQVEVPATTGVSITTSPQVITTGPPLVPGATTAAAPVVEPSSPSKDNKAGIIAAAVLIPIGVIAIIAIVIFLVYRRRNRRLAKDNRGDSEINAQQWELQVPKDEKKQPTQDDDSGSDSGSSRSSRSSRSSTSSSSSRSSSSRSSRSKSESGSASRSRSESKASSRSGSSSSSSGSSSGSDSGSDSSSGSSK